MADERDWYRVVAVERCPEFHLSARDIRRDALGSALLESAEAWSRVLAAPTRALRRSPARRTWSALEYGAHVRDVLGLFAGRIDRALAEDEPEFEWWDHEEAVLAERYNGQDPAMVARQLLSNADRLVASLVAVEGDAWSRMGVRRRRERFSVEGLARFALHEAHHHRVDAQRALSETGEVKT